MVSLTTPQYDEQTRKKPLHKIKELIISFPQNEHAIHPSDVNTTERVCTRTRQVFQKVSSQTEKIQHELAELVEIAGFHVESYEFWCKCRTVQ